MAFAGNKWEHSANLFPTMSEETNAAPSTPGEFCWNELVSGDVEASKKFYQETFGWTADTVTMAPGFEYTMFKLGEKTVAGMIGIRPEMGPIQPHWVSYVNSVDLEGDTEKARAAGGKILREPFQVPSGGSLAIVQDPQGAVFALWKNSERHEKTC